MLEFHRPCFSQQGPTISIVRQGHVIKSQTQWEGLLRNQYQHKHTSS